MGADGTIVQLFGVGSEAVSAVVSAQRRVNMYADTSNAQDKGGLTLYPRPGLAIYDEAFGPRLVRGFMDGELSQSFSGARPLCRTYPLSSLYWRAYSSASHGASFSAHTVSAKSNRGMLSYSIFHI